MRLYRVVFVAVRVFCQLLKLKEELAKSYQHLRVLQKSLSRWIWHEKIERCWSLKRFYDVENRSEHSVDNLSLVKSESLSPIGYWWQSNTKVKDWKWHEVQSMRATIRYLLKVSPILHKQDIFARVNPTWKTRECDIMTAWFQTRDMVAEFRRGSSMKRGFCRRGW